MNTGMWCIKANSIIPFQEDKDSEQLQILMIS